MLGLAYLRRLFLADSLSYGTLLATDQQTTFELNWTRFCVIDNHFCFSQ